MASRPFPYDVAVRATNLLERTEVLAAMGIAPDERCGAELPEHEVRWLNRLAEKLTRQVAGHDPGRGEKIKGVLAAYRMWERHSDCDEAQADLLARIHRRWLPTYRDAFDAFGAFGSDVQHRALGLWRHDQVYYGRLACVSDPFLSYAQGRVASTVSDANRLAGSELFAPTIIEDVVLHLVDRFQLPVTWAIEADKNVYCARMGITAQDSTTKAYLAYLAATFVDSSSYHRFYLRFPVLGRWLAQMTVFACEASRRMLERLGADLDEIAVNFFETAISKVLAVRLGKSDFHADGQSVARVEVELATGEQAAFIYKPRSVDGELATQRLLAVMASDKVMGFAPYRVAARDGYGYAELIPATRNRVESRDEAAAIYEELGGYLAIFHIFGGSDLHFENLLVADGHLSVCDCETILGVRPVGQDEAAGTVMDSVYKTGMLEWPHVSEGGEVAQMRLSGLAGGEPYRFPAALPLLNDDNMSFNVGVHHEEGVEVDPGGANRVYIGDQIAAPTEFKDAIIRGFDRVHGWFATLSPTRVAEIADLFGHSEVRFLNFATQLYAQLLMGAYHPKCLMDPLQVDLVFNRLEEHSQRWDRGHQLAASEVAALWQLDVPIYTVGASDMQLMSAHRDPVSFALAASPLQELRARIGRLTPANCRRQVQYIAASLEVKEVHSLEFIATSLEYARRVGQKLCALVEDGWEGSLWRDLEVTSDGVREVDILTNLYDGTAGIAFFLAYLDAFVDDRRLRAVAQRALAHAVVNCPHDRIGAFQGTSGLIYVLTHLAQLWKDDRLLDQAIALSHDVAGGIASDRHFDVLTGAAGVIPVMLGLSRQAAGEGLLCAHACGRHLLEHAERDEHGLSWPPFRASDAVANLTGFAHGPSGVGWALIALGSATGCPEYVAAALEGFRYERAYFDDQKMDWYDLRSSILAMTRGARHFANAWCNGAAGIGMSRIASWALLGRTDDELLKDANIALSATLRNFHSLGNDSLCHGRSGNSELYLRYAQLKEEPVFQMEAHLQAHGQWNDLEVTGHTLETETSGRVFPGLMMGLSGTGHHFLRLAYPDRVPSPLLLDPPPPPAIDPPSPTNGRIHTNVG